MSESHIKYSIGIDLGTSNSALAIAEIDSIAPAQSIDITQLISRKGVGKAAVLPSCIYIATEEEQKHLPRVQWQEEQSCRIGMFAREHGSEVPERLVTSAKSWLCNSDNDPYQPILPWQSPWRSANSPLWKRKRFTLPICAITSNTICSNRVKNLICASAK